MTDAVLRKELQGYIADMPRQNLYMLRPLLSGLSGLSKRQAIIEPASEEEEAMIDAAMAEREKDPASFTDWETAKKEMGFA